ncbi:hypothetical protein [Rhizobium tumorigenes]|uniref:Uncharacterized protein n=1 Tax=Rhizobium tumorigenes TaxID=2041385 RepID=A0AAF1KMN2_9HYPH|nr:hypothetical protein [Rhizobium tumorigenes]WFR98013.1 hypothetical protein PR017_19195 [Rhizobium tumorigenes]WFS03558.1 hypothetical protein PR016_19970 [Rhizobium tumorigenes]
MTFEPDAKLPVQGSLSRVNALDLNAERVWTYQHTIDLGQHPRFALSGTWIRLSACALIIGVSSAAAYTTQWHGAANPPAARPSIHTASLHGGVKPTGLMAAIDSSPARGASTSPFPLAPVVAIPFSKPANYAFDKIASPRANKPTSPIKRPSNLEVLKECGSKCQRRDHQAVGSIRHGQVSNNALLTKGDEAGRGFRPLQQAQYVLEQTAAVPWLAIETGRNAIRSIADLD